jgi:hypothetical protein
MKIKENNEAPTMSEGGSGGFVVLLVFDVIGIIVIYFLNPMEVRSARYTSCEIAHSCKRNLEAFDVWQHGN